MKHRLTKQAARDISKILTNTYRLFGQNQFGKYVEIIDRGITLVAGNPLRPSSKARDDIRPGVRSFHLQFAASRQSGAGHVLYYHIIQGSEEESELIVIRVLADEMEPKRRVLSGMRSGLDE